MSTHSEHAVAVLFGMPTARSARAGVKPRCALGVAATAGMDVAMGGSRRPSGDYFVRGREWKPSPSSCAPIQAASSDLLSGT